MVKTTCKWRLATDAMKSSKYARKCVAFKYHRARRRLTRIVLAVAALAAKLSFACGASEGELAAVQGGVVVLPVRELLHGVGGNVRNAAHGRGKPGVRGRLDFVPTLKEAHVGEVFHQLHIRTDGRCRRHAGNVNG